jgi:hypothetical protein
VFALRAAREGSVITVSGRSTRRSSLRRRAASLVGALGVAMLAALSGASPASGLTTYTVTNTSSNPATVGSLPWAVNQANYATIGFDAINFNLPGSGPFEINLTQTLYLNDQIAINGASQPGYNGTPLVWITGGSGVPSLFLLQNDRGTTSSGSTIQGLGMYRYTSNAITIMPGSVGNWIQNNWMGFRPTAGGVLRNTASGLPNATTSRGIGIASSWNVVRNNTISGVDNGVVIGMDSQQGAPYKTNSIQQNRIGTDPTGTTTWGYGNTGDGIFLGPGAQENWLGPDNVLSGNASAGVELLHNTNRGNVVFRNNIGLDASGMNRLGNGELGVLFSGGAWFNAIGGPFGGNTIAGNTLGGISIGTSAWGGSSLAWIQYNTIGLNKAGQEVGGQAVGVAIGSGSRQVLVEGNVIGGNAQHGVIVGDSRARGTSGNAVNGNYIGRTADGTWRANGAYGIFFLNAGYNWAVGNMFGANAMGNIGSLGSPGLVIG